MPGRADPGWPQTTARRRLAPGLDPATTIHYALSRWPALTRYRDEGQLEIGNNIAERALRYVALGCKNYLFAGADAVGDRAVAMYTLIGTALLNDVNPEAYLGHVLERIAGLPVNRIDELLPWNVKEAVAVTAEV